MADTVDIPGLNPIVARRILRATTTTCNAFRGSDHGNALPHTTGESVRCLNCDDPQWKHWLRQALFSGEHLAAGAVTALIGKWRADAAFNPRETSYGYRYGLEKCAKELEALLVAARDPVTETEAEGTVKSIAAMLGWMHVPPWELLEADIRALKSRAARAPAVRTEQE